MADGASKARRRATGARAASAKPEPAVAPAIRPKRSKKTLHGVWFDEEPPLDIYCKGLTRTNATGGITIVTFTLLLGMSDVVLRFLCAAEVERIGKR